jgi:signal transduction histidine kinase
MLKTLYSKLVAVLLALFCLIGVFFLIAILLSNRMYFQEVRQKLNYPLAQHIVSGNVLFADGRVNEEALKKVFTTLMVINPDIELYLLDSKGRILSFAAPPGKVKRSDVSLEPIRKFLSGKSSYPILGDDPRDSFRKKVFSAAPIELNNQTGGYLYIILGGEKYDSVAQMLQGSYIIRTSVFIAGGSLLFALLTGLLLFKQLTRRLGKLAAAMEDFKKGEFYEKPEYLDRYASDERDEIGRLGLTFAKMADMIQAQMKALKHADTHRRELVSSISHDLRTPLASLSGYLETLLLKESELRTEEKRDYLKTAIKHCERLEKLISELFELSKLDSPDVKLDIEPFSLSDHVQDVVQKLQITAGRKGISIRPAFEGDISLVYADIGLIERVMDNLIENALRFSSKGDTVTISVIPDQDRVIVKVTDTGSGISKEDLPFIFDRFYQAKRQNGEKIEGSGIGLSIAKRIVELHRGSLEVESSLNRGTTFTFSLPAKIVET